MSLICSMRMNEFKRRGEGVGSDWWARTRRVVQGAWGGGESVKGEWRLSCDWACVSLLRWGVSHPPRSTHAASRSTHAASRSITQHPRSITQHHARITHHHAASVQYPYSITHHPRSTRNTTTSSHLSLVSSHCFHCSSLYSLALLLT